MPKRIIILITIVLLLGFIGAINPFSMFGISYFGQQIELMILTITLTALIFYVYYNYLIAKEAWTPAANFHFEQFEDDPFHIRLRLRSYSKLTLETWGKLTANVDGKRVGLTRFYAKKRPWVLYPFDNGFGHFKLKQLAERANTTLDKLRRKNGVLKFSFVLTYKAIETDEEKKAGPKNYYFDFETNSLVLDV
jgi:hypothetical protein